MTGVDRGIHHQSSVMSKKLEMMGSQRLVNDSAYTSTKEKKNLKKLKSRLINLKKNPKMMSNEINHMEYDSHK